MTGPAARHPWAGYALAILAAVCWAASGLTAKWLFSWGVPSIDPVSLSASRAVFSFLLLGGSLAIARPGLLRVKRRDIPFLALFGVGGLAMVHLCYFTAISLTNVATAILLEYQAPVIVLLVATLWHRERFTWNLPAGVLLSVAGCALVAGIADGAATRVSPAGLAWGLGAAFFFALNILMGRSAADRIFPAALLLWGLGFASLFWIAYLRSAAPFLAPFADPRAAAGMVLIIVLGTIVPFGALLLALTLIDPTRVSVITTIEPVIAGAGAWLIFGERLSPYQIAGAVTVLAALVTVQLPLAAGRRVGVGFAP